MINCPFCKLLKEDHDTFVCRMKYGSMYVNLNQVFYGRCIYIYHKHAEDITGVDSTEFCNANEEVLVIAKTLKRVFQPQLINIASLGNHVQHLHWHIIPRYKEDPNWGNPPWPHGEKLLTPSGYRKLADHILREMELYAEI